MAIDAQAMEFTGERFIPDGVENEIMLEHVHRYLMASTLCEGGVVLDAACGAGYGTAILSTKATRAHGVDIDLEAVDHARQNYGGDKVSFHAASVTELPFSDHTFDVIVSFETLEHLVEQEQMLDEFRRVLKPGGTLVVSTPDKPIYNAALGEPNAFHVRELTRAEFTDLLRPRFQTLEFYGQRIAFGSLVVPGEPGAPLRAVRRLPENGMRDEDAYDASMYIIAVCSDGPVRPLPVGVYEGAVPQNAMASLLGGIAERDQLVREWRERAEIAEADQPRLAALEAEQRRLTDENEALRERSEEQVRYLALAAQTLKELGGAASGFDSRFWSAVGQGHAADGGRMADTALYQLATVGVRRTFGGAARAVRRRWSSRFNLKQALGDVFVAARRARLRPGRTLRLLRDIRLVRASGLIDPDFYAPQKARTPIPGFEDARNYVLVGRELDPNRLFSGPAYLRLNPDVAGQETTPLVHYILHGEAEGRGFEPAATQGMSRLRDPEDRPKQAWPLAEGKARSALEHYDLRPEDDIIGESWKGQDFLDRHRLLGDAPDFAGAVEELRAMVPPSRILSEGEERPRASIVIPIYGQLAYTLNCLHALLGHGAHNSFEILVGDDASPDESGRWLPQIPHIRYVRQPRNLGFVDNCNTTAALARGDYIVLLNNDTRVAAGWLDAMIDSFGLFPEAGLIGSKLFYPGGALQEAGGIFWRDGSAWNYGREDDPNRPRYCYAREVDYVSGASIAIPAALWAELGGFDTIYRPAYCEDSDIAFRIRDKGLQTWMQPLSRVIHYEGRTSGTDVTQGVKAYQVENSKKLAQRWAGALEGFRPSGQSPMFERDRKAQKRVLVIDATTPTPKQDAGSVTSVTHMQLYQQLGYKVYFAPLHNFLFQPQETGELHRMGIECAYAPYEPNLEAFLQAHGRYLDLVHVFRVDVAIEALPLLRRYAPEAPVIFANMDMHYLRLERQAEAEKSETIMREAREMKARELGLISSVDCVIVHSPVEEAIIRAEAPAVEMVVFPFITPLMGTSAEFAARRDVMFLGGYRHTPNIDAAVFLTREIWPLVRAELPSARLLLVGAHPTPEIQALATDDVIVTGMVEDLRPCFDQTRVFAAAIRYGAGVKGKVATAMSYGVPVVATTIAAEGMFLEDGRDVVIADEPAAFAKAIVELYRDSEAWSRFSSDALKFVSEMNSMDTGRRILAEAIDCAHREHARNTVTTARQVLCNLLPVEK